MPTKTGEDGAMKTGRDGALGCIGEQHTQCATSRPLLLERTKSLPSLIKGGCPLRGRGDFLGSEAGTEPGPYRETLTPYPSPMGLGEG